MQDLRGVPVSRSLLVGLRILVVVIVLQLRGITGARYLDTAHEIDRAGAAGLAHRTRRGSGRSTFPTITGTRLSRDAVEHRLAHHVATARQTCLSLRSKRVGMHTLRHSAPMRLLESGTDVTVIALWLGHEDPSTTARIYLHADMTQKQKAVDRLTPPGTTPGRYRPPDILLAFLDAL